jgi:acyl-CoA synthetase (AMP-forming)/AMP-acid ligase II
VAALINTHIGGRGLAHAITVAGPDLVVVGSEHAAKLRETLPLIESIDAERVLVQADDDGDRPEASASEALPFDSLDAALAAAPDSGPEPSTTPRGGDTMCYIYTSGTTGLPKAAIVSNQRFLAAGAMFGRTMLELSPDDVVYITLPLYHSNAMFGGWGAVLATGACLALRRRFSASAFWSDVRRFGATHFVYIGELCRYLLNQPESAFEHDHCLRIAAGNGLRPDIWERFQHRFGIPLIREFYGATEGNAPLVNLEGRPGMVGRLRRGQAVVRCNQTTGAIERDAQGRGRRVEPGETGLLLGRIDRFMTFDGYVDREATNRKVVQDVLARGDRWFDTGDLLTVHPGGWLSFADRVGDTFRWKGENVSTTEVAEVLNGAPGVLESNVYGVSVPGAEGRAGMASLRCTDDFSIEAFQKFVLEALPVYQRPYFVRRQDDMRVTGTFKHQKVDYREEAYDPARVADPLYFLDGDRYVPIDDGLYEAIRSGRTGLR